MPKKPVCFQKNWDITTQPKELYWKCPMTATVSKSSAHVYGDIIN
nr:MAG TPA: hypothetical protein [Caudoviricetes sp.]